MSQATVRLVGIGAAGAMLIGAFAPRRAAASDFVCVQGTQTKVCLKWSHGAPPEQNADFAVSFADQAWPVIELWEGDLGWELYAEKLSDGSPANIGAVTINPNSSSENFKVKIAKGSAAGAAHVESIDLSASGWSGYSSCGGGRIAGSLLGDFRLVKSSGGSGGELSGELYLLDEVQGDIEIPVITWSGYLSVANRVYGDVDIGSNEGYLLFLGVVDGAIAVDELNGTLNIWRKPESALGVQIGDFEYGTVSLGTNQNPIELDVPVFLGNGVPQESVVTIFGSVASAGEIDLDDGDVVGLLEVRYGGEGAIVNGGDVSGTVRLALYEGEAFVGTATFAGIVSGGTIETGGGASKETDVHFDGTLHVTGDCAGTIIFNGDCGEDGLIDIDGAMTGSGLIDIAADCSGDITVGGQMGSQTKILLESDLASTGSIAVGGLLDGDIVINGDCSGDIALASAMRYGSSITVGDDLAGALSINGNVNGDIAIAGDLTGAIGAAYSLTSTGRILIDGACAGGIIIGRDTASTSLIRAIGGLTSCC